MIEKVIDIQIKDNAEQAVGSLKSQLRQAQAEVAELSNKFGTTSKEAIEAAKRAGELKDKIGDAKNLTDAFNPDAKFKAFSPTPVQVQFTPSNNISITSSTEKGIPLNFKTFLSISKPVSNLIKLANCPLALFSRITVLSAFSSISLVSGCSGKSCVCNSWLGLVCGMTLLNIVNSRKLC